MQQTRQYLYSEEFEKYDRKEKEEEEEEIDVPGGGVVINEVMT